MFRWLKGKNKGNVGPDFSAINSRDKAKDLFLGGKLQKLLLMPTEFGGQDFPPNVVYVPAFVLEQKTRIDRNIIQPLLDKGSVSRYEATPEYDGDSFIPSAIRIVASDPGTFSAKIAIWGKGLQEQTAPAAPETKNIENVTAKEVPIEFNNNLLNEPQTLVRAFIIDFLRWNNESHTMSSTLPGAEWMSKAAQNYTQLISRYCRPSFKHQPVSFGSESDHDLSHEEIVSSHNEGTKTIVKTKATKVIASTTLVSNYEYVLTQENGRWYLENLFYVINDEKIDGL
jgi:hypothetical protein